MKRIISSRRMHILMTGILMVFLFTAVFSAAAFAGTKPNATVKIGKKAFDAVLYDNETARALQEKMPVKYRMSDLNGNEKYKYLNEDLPMSEKKIKRIKAGDIMLYGSDCLVVFYKSFNTTYEYTRIGRLTETKGLKKAAGKGKVTVRFMSKEPAPDEPAVDKPEEEEQMNQNLTVFINDQEVSVSWLENDAVARIRELAGEKPIEIKMSRYGGFEQVGAIGTDLPRNDLRITTLPGDIVLYSGNQIVMFYGSNTWAYTKLGHITNMDQSGLEELLGKTDVTLKISVGPQGE